MTQQPNSESSVIHLSVRAKIVFSLLTTIAFFLLLELLVRLIGLGKPPVIGRLQFGYKTGIPIYDEDGVEREGATFSEPLFQEDDTLFWRPIRSTRFTGAKGFRLPEPSQIEKPKRTFRIAVLGDSCSFLGKKPYPMRLAELLEHSLHQPVEVINASCPGYSSFQGVMRATEIWHWEPDVLIVYFGWNDHWKSLNGLPDQAVAERRHLLSQPRHWLRQSCAVELLAQFMPSRVPTAVDNPRQKPVRVPPPHFHHNLQALGDSAAGHDCPIVFVTAPTSFQTEAMPKWASVFFRDFYQMSEDEIAAIPDVHAGYCDIVRNLSEQWPQSFLVDAHKQWGFEDSARRFRQDCIHLTEEGHSDLASLIFKTYSPGLSPNAPSGSYPP